MPRPRKELSADGLIALIRKGCDKVSDPRCGSFDISMGELHTYDEAEAQWTAIEGEAA